MSLPQESPTKGSPWTFRIATIVGIPVRLHITFLLFLAWLGWVGGTAGLLLVTSLFLCVLLHEFGHALAARHYGIGTRDITLYPIGGVAMLAGRMRPRHELWVALAGPAVNAVIAALAYVALRLDGQTVTSLSVGDSFLRNLFSANVIMAAFNMIPAFPMDGGRVLRAILARKMPDARATQIAANVGQILAIGLFLFGLLSPNVVLTLVAFFIFLAAGQESQAETTRSFLTGHRVTDAMQTRFRTVSHGASLETVAEMLLAGSQADFPVETNGEIVGVVTRSDIAIGLANSGPDAYIAGVMRREPKTANPNAPLEDVVEMLTKDDPSPVLVMDDGRLLGMVTAENVGEFLMLEHARNRAKLM